MYNGQGSGKAIDFDLTKMPAAVFLNTVQSRGAECSRGSGRFLCAPVLFNIQCDAARSIARLSRF